MCCYVIQDRLLILLASAESSVEQATSSKPPSSSDSETASPLSLFNDDKSELEELLPRTRQ